ncbi:MAG: insulinase family protein [Bacteroidales bacterium]|nr:insulinase family protein [Bacteroidales bacterium]
MKRYLLLLVLCIAAVCLFAQPMKIETYTLKNGMQVMLCEDHQQPSIYGAVLVHVGSKNDPADNTGMAHYLEHLMFKGTDQIGTTDWAAEKPLLDEIDRLYDALHKEENPSSRQEIVKKLNDVSARAAQYAIPNEVDVILSKMGGTGVNAFTSNDVTCYHNMFPSNQLEKWLTVYAERFRKPVFRLFQSELEAVYEEFNMYSDQPTSVFFEDAIAAAYGDHPYARPVIGYQEHLKNPQTSAMKSFFARYYHPYNMTLILVGDFRSNEIMPLLESTMGKMHNENLLEERGLQTQKLVAAPVKRMGKPVAPFKGVKTVTVAETPVNMGILAFQTVGSGDPEAFYLDIMSGLLNNEANTGLLDELTQENKLMEAGAFNYAMLEHGLYTLFYVPKLSGQSHEDAEKQVLNAIDRLRKGDFSDELFEAVKMECLRDYYESMESLTSKFYTMIDIASNNFDPNVYFEREKLLRSLTKDDLIERANKVFGQDYLSFRSTVGQKDIKRLEKPSWKPIVTKNAELSSPFAQKIESMPVEEIKCQQVDFDVDVQRSSINPAFPLYYKENPYNDIFTLQLIFQYGQLQDPLLPVATDYLSYQGTGPLSGTQFQLELQKLGAEMDITVSDRETYITISGFDSSLEKVLHLCGKKLYEPANDEKYLDLIVEKRSSEAQMNHSDAETWGSALYYYALYGKNSPYLKRPSIQNIKKVSGISLLSSFAYVLMSPGCVTYVGRTPMDEVTELLRSNFQLNEKGTGMKKPVREQIRYSEPRVFLASNPRFMQSNIYFLINGSPLQDYSIAQKMLYNEYMGGSVASVIFQDIRELRSLGYSAYGAYSYDERTKAPGYTMGYLGTQADKTNEGVDAMSELLLTFPQRPEKFEMAKTAAIRQQEAAYISFRQMPDRVRIWEEMGYSQDPRPKILDALKRMTMDDVRKFHQTNIGKRPLVVTIAGDARRFDTKELKKIGKVVKVKYKDIITD